MVLQQLKISGYRNLVDTSLEFSQELNCFVGRNGQGKTNLLESIYCLGLTKSFRTSKDQELVSLDKDEFQIHGTFQTELGVQHKISIHYALKKKRSTLIARNSNALPG